MQNRRPQMSDIYLTYLRHLNVQMMKKEIGKRNERNERKWATDGRQDCETSL